MSLILDLIFPQPKINSRLFIHQSVTALNGFDGVLSLFKYQPPLVSLIHSLKYEFVTDLADKLANISADTIKQNYPNLLRYWQDNHFLLLPIPLHPWRHNWRGFNQSILIGEQLSQILNIDYSATLLSRYRYSSPQALQPSKISRLSNLSHVFQLNSSPPSNIILFDDLITTGSTLQSAASVFPSGTQIWGLSIAG